MLSPLQSNHQDPSWSTCCQVHRAFLSHAFFHSRQQSHSTLVPTEQGETIILTDHGKNSTQINWIRSDYLTNHNKANENCPFHMHTQGLQPTQSIYFPKIVAWQELIQINSISVITLGQLATIVIPFLYVGKLRCFTFFFLSRGYAGELCKACLSKSKFCLSFQLANKINSNLTCTIKQSNPMNTVLQDNTPRVIYIRKWQARLEYVVSTCTFALKLGRPFL